jgi:hypothetical protein
MKGKMPTKTKYKLPPKGEIYRLLVELKKQIGDEYRASDDPHDDKPGMSVTISADEEGRWNYQTGDNSFTGGAYGLPYWAVISLYRNSNSRELASEVLDQLADLMSL